jgi:hypothetical protein
MAHGLPESYYNKDKASQHALFAIGRKKKKGLANPTMVKMSQPDGLNSSFPTAIAEDDPSCELESLSYNRHIPKM